MDLVKMEQLAPLLKRIWGLAFVVVLCAGCGSGVESYVSGEVTLDGNALESGRVVFSPRGDAATQGATGQIGSNGRYEVQTGRSGGLKSGEYAVTVSSRKRPKPSSGGGPPAPGKLLTPKKYRNSSTTDLLVEVKPGSNDIDLALTSE